MTQAAGASIRFDDVFKSFGDTVVLAGVSLDIGPGEIFALLGPSGSGKTTMLRLLAGFERLDRGRLLIQGEPVEHLPPARRGVGMLFQSYALFPHLSVAENVAFGLQVRGGASARGEVEARVAEMLELARLDGFGPRRIAELSGGQQQRVALARALAPRPRVLLLDEPLSNLDPALREETRADLCRTIKRTGITTVLVTHEQEEAFELGERVGVLRDGLLEQIASPVELYRSPASRFVASFVGRCSVLPGVVEGRGDGDEIEVRIASPGAAPQGAIPRVWRCRDGDGVEIGARVDVCARPESLELVSLERVASAQALGAAGELTGTIESERYTGSNSFYTVRLDGGRDGPKPQCPRDVSGARGTEAGSGSIAVEVAMPGTAAGLTGACVVRPLPHAPPPRAFAAASSPTTDDAATDRGVTNDLAEIGATH